jgi:hypothetical protein
VSDKASGLANPNNLLTTRPGRRTARRPAETLLRQGIRKPTVTNH